MVLESVVSSGLNQILSAYLENFNPNQPNVGIWGCDIKLKNLKLKRGALDNRPVKAAIDNIYLLAIPSSESKFDPEDDERRKQATKMEKLKNSELLLSSTAGTPGNTSNEEAEKNESFVAAMTNKILDNLQLRIKNVHPVSAEGKLLLRKHPTKDLAKINYQLTLVQLAFLIDADQYQDALSCLDLFHFYTRRREFLRFHPGDPSVTENKARALWSFAIAATKHEVHQRAYKWTWDCFRQRRDDCKLYISLFKAAQLGTLSVDLTELDDLEKRLTYQDIRYYRSLARSEMRQQRITAKHQQTNSNDAKSTSWLGWLWGGSKGPSDQEDPNFQSDSVLNEEDKRKLYEAIEWDEKEATSSAQDTLRGEISASNAFTSDENKSVTKTKAGIHNNRLTSEMHHEGHLQTLQLLVDVNIDVRLASFNKEQQNQDSDQGLDTDPQYFALMSLVMSLPKNFYFRELNQESLLHMSSPGLIQVTAASATTDSIAEIAPVAKTADGEVVFLDY
ncbi:hypothetical protein O181_000962 [Austropuccinia psidii MF-1]|uniref:Chorein N-terminal domain-containing protein n=1 Tax=Austropuccinia psidii MF-1 TaxID=1389203 RepID=A0A9Q3GCK0_9BASI|nr:hypothetical protein [Austropuccinia psidii MF-1]